MAQDDTDQWVAVAGNILKKFPGTGSLNVDIDEHHSFFHEVLNDLKKLVRKASDVDMPPLECLYLGRAALSAVAGPTPTATRHFSMKRKPKSASLRMEVLQKSSDAANNIKKTGTSSSVPVKFRSFAKRMDDTTPMRGLPSYTSTSSGGFLKASTLARSFGGNASQKLSANKREVGIKLIGMDELPLTGREAKRRRKQQEQEALEKHRVADKAAAASAATPDYAVSLVNLQPAASTAPAPVQVQNVVTLNAPTAQPSYLPTTVTRLVSAPAPVQVSIAGTGSTPVSLLTPQLQTTVAAPRVITTPVPVVISAAKPTRIIISTSQPGVAGTVRMANVVRSVLSPAGGLAAPIRSATPNLSALSATPNLAALAATQIITAVGAPGQAPVRLTLTAQQLQQLRQQQQLQQAQQQHQQQQQQQQVQQQQQQQIRPLQTQQVQQPLQTLQQPQQQQTQQQAAQPQQAQQQPKKGLSLTKEQMLQAQEMFRNSNKVTRPEKALILGFMAGSRENPCPQQGHIVNIRLSEDQDSIQQADLTFRPMVVDTYFQMNYSTGEWKRIKKYRELEPE